MLQDENIDKNSQVVNKNSIVVNFNPSKNLNEEYNDDENTIIDVKNTKKELYVLDGK